MDRSESLIHSRWECKYQVIFIPKRRRKTLYGALRQHLGEVFHRLAGQKGSEMRRWFATTSVSKRKPITDSTQ